MRYRSSSSSGDFVLAASLAGEEQQRIVYQLRPVERGEYIFNDINLFIKAPST